MAGRAYPISRVKLYEAGVRSRAKYDGFGRYDLAGELVRGNLVQISQVSAEELGLWEGRGYGVSFPAAMHVGAGGLDTVLCRPFLDTSQGIGLGHFRGVGGRWRALKGLGLNQEARLYQEDGTPNLATGVESRFTLPHNPLFAVSLWRAEPGLGHDWSQPPYTEIHFGIGEQEEWAVIIPYGSPMFLIRRQGAAWEKAPYTEKALRMPTLEGMARGQRSFLWFGVMEGKAVLSTDGFAEDVMVFETPGQPVEIRQGRVSLWHNAGQWCCSFFPVKMAPASILSGPIETGYLTGESAGEVFAHGRTLPVRDDLGQVRTQVDVVDDTEEREGLTATQRSWRVQIWPYRHWEQNVGVDPDTEQTVDFSTWVSPEWMATQEGQFAEVEVNEAITHREVSADVTAVTGEQADEQLAGRYEVALDNQLGAYSDLAEYRRVTVGLGWRKDDGSEELMQVCDGFVVEPPLVTLPGGASETAINVLDPMLRLRDEKADGRTPVFDGWPVNEVFRWALARCGIGAAQQDLEDTGTALTVGPPGTPAWQVEPGRTWSEFLAEVARFDYNAAICFDGQGVLRKTCRYCRQKRTAADVTLHTGALGSACPSAVTWELYTRGAIAPDPEQTGEVLELSRTRHSLSGEEYANYVVVCGPGLDGRPARAVMYDAASLSDPSSDRFVGWRKMDVWGLPGMVGQATVNRLAAERFGQLSPRPEHVVVTTPLLPGAQVGQVLRVNGGETAGAAGKLYRIRSVRHEVSRKPEVVAVTVLEARWLGDG